MANTHEPFTGEELAQVRREVEMLARMNGIPLRYATGDFLLRLLDEIDRCLLDAAQEATRREVLEHQYNRDVLTREEANGRLIDDRHNLLEENKRLRSHIGELTRIAIFAEANQPDTIAEYYGDINPTIEAALRVLNTSREKLSRN